MAHAPPIAKDRLYEYAMARIRDDWERRGYKAEEDVEELLKLVARLRADIECLRAALVEKRESNGELF